MTAPRANVRFDDDVVVVEFSSVPATRSVQFEGVVDRTDLGEVVGLEILDFRRQFSDVSPPSYSGTDLPRWSYDDEVDAFYLRLTDATATLQRPIVGTAALDGAGCVVALEIPSGP